MAFMPSDIKIKELLALQLLSSLISRYYESPAKFSHTLCNQLHSNDIILRLETKPQLLTSSLLYNLVSRACSILDVIVKSSKYSNQLGHRGKDD